MDYLDRLFLKKVPRVYRCVPKRIKKEVKNPSNVTSSKVKINFREEYKLGEGSPFFTNRQIVDFGLNADSY